MDLKTDAALSALKRTAERGTLTPTEAAEKKAARQELKKACDGFEELFIHKMFQVMRKSSTKTGLLSGGRGEEIFQDMLDQQYSEMITKTSALGLSRMIFEHTKKFV